MEIEIEAKFLDVDVKALSTALEKCGATLVREDRLMRRKKKNFLCLLTRKSLSKL